MTDPDGKPEIVEAPAIETEQPEPGFRRSFLVIVEEHRRLQLLQMLAEVPCGCGVNLLRSGLLSQYQDVAEGELAAMADWLAGAGLIEIRGDSPRILRLTERGLAVVEGRIRASGVAWAPGT